MVKRYECTECQRVYWAEHKICTYCGFGDGKRTDVIHATRHVWVPENILKGERGKWVRI